MLRLPLLLLLAALAHPAAAGPLEPGDLVVVDTSARALVRVDPESGARETLLHWTLDGAKHPSFPWGMAWEPSGRILLGDMNARAIFAVDPDTRQFALVSGGDVGRGLKLAGVRGIALDGAGGLYASVSRRTGKVVHHMIFRVDLATGDRRVVSALDVGRGPELAYPADVVVDADGSLIVAQRGESAIYRIDPATGDRTEVSSPKRGSGPELGSPFGLALLVDGSLAVTDRKTSRVFQIDLRSGDRRVVASPEVGSGPVMTRPFGVAQAPDGDLYVADIGTWSIYHVGLADGARRIVSSSDVGSGPPIEMPRNLLVVPGDPAAPTAGAPRVGIVLVLVVAGLAVAFGLLRARRRAA